MQRQIARHQIIFYFVCSWLIFLVMQFGCVGMVSARSIAFFPLLDLSKDLNGINSKLTGRVYQELVNRGKDLVPPDKIMHFLVRNRIRRLGQLTKYQIVLVGKELGAELLLQGTVCQLNDGEKPELSLNLQLSRTADGQVIWAHTENLSYADCITLFALDEPRSLEDLYRPFFARLLATLPENRAGEATAFDTLDIGKILIQPKYLRWGETVSCRIKMRTPLDKKRDRPKLFIQVGTEELPLVPDKENYYLQTSWTAEQSGGSYPVTLVAHWPSGTVLREGIGSYTVDVRPPGAELHLLGIERDGEILFSKKLVITPKLLEPEPTARWQISVFNEDDEAIVIMGDSGNIPLHLTWKGKTSLGNMAEPGDYLIRFKVWDRAERVSTAEAKVRYMPEPPEIEVEVKREENEVFVDIDNAVETPLNYWWAKFFAEDGHLLKLAQGTELPATVDLGRMDEPKKKIQCLLVARDILGNQSEQKIPDLFQAKESDKKEDDSSKETEWVEEF